MEDSKNIIIQAKNARIIAILADEIFRDIPRLLNKKLQHIYLIIIKIGRRCLNVPTSL